MWLLGAAERGRDGCVPPHTRDPVGRRGRPERRCHSPYTPLGFRLFGNEAVLGKARCRVWLGVAAPRSAPPPMSRWVGGAPIDWKLWKGVRTYSCGCAMPNALGARAGCQNCCLCFTPCSLDGTAHLGEWEYGHCNFSLGCNYWDEVLKVPLIESSAAGAVTMLPRRWCGGGAESHRGLEMWPGTTFPGVPLMFSYCG